ncbi:hypothetical protein D9613_000994 [Agrocybe pediades]|uniref:Helicase SWR1 n=1 Tax=Agrocybe pediades TaxID=84607 RepID=A0A8H4R3I5_9AGAR|nr:hypothetical protein D9613_000994 [Agrocybe pediades]
MSGNEVDMSVAESTGTRASTARGRRRGGGIDGDVDRAKKDSKPAFRVVGTRNGAPTPVETDEARQAKVLAAKQLELDGIVDRHDDLVRELFHMENFTMMLSYDPPEAKADNTAVFREYKSKYDLIERAAPVAGPSRQTRGRRNEQRQVLTSTSISAQPPSAKKPAKGKGKATRTEILQTLQAVHNHKGKGKEREILPELETPLEDTSKTLRTSLETVSAPAAVFKGPPATPIPQRRSKRKSLHMTEPEPPISASIPAPIILDPADADLPDALPCPPSPVVQRSPEPPRKKSRRTNPGQTNATTTMLNGDVRAAEAPATSKNGINGVVYCPPEPPPLEESISTAPRRRSARHAEPPAIPNLSQNITKIKFRAPMEDNSPRAVLPPSNVAVQPSPSKFMVKKVKLIVRRPVPTLTNPKQIPPPPMYDYSLSKFLMSYTAIDDEDIDPEKLKQEAKEEAIIRERVVQFRNDGRFIPGTDVLFGTEPSDIHYISPQRTSRDIWDDIVAAVVAKGKSKQRKPLGKQIANQIASKVQSHFDGQENRKIRAKEQEEKRLRNLAKSTMKAVIAEWKKAVHHIRNKQREEQEAEERRLGHMHLDAILDQSGQLLETQQSDLTRGGLFGSRSRSGSIGDMDEDVDDEEGTADEDEGDGQGQQDEETDEEEDGDDNRTHDTKSMISSVAEDEEGQEEEEEEEDGDTTLLLGPMQTESHASSSRARSPTAASTTTGLDEEDPETSTNQLLGGANEELANADASDGSSKVSNARPTGASSPLLPEVGEAEQVDTDSMDVVEESQTQQHEETHPVDDSGAMEEDENQEKEAADEPDDDDQLAPLDSEIPEYLKPFAVAPVKWDPDKPVTPPLLLRGTLRPYQQSGLEWLASLHTNRLNGILADEMGLGKTIQTISLLAHLACDRGIWGPHLIVVPTSVLLNWEMEFKKFLPGFRVLSYHGSTKRRKELRQGWNDKYSFNVCITSYQLASRDAHIIKRKPWYYMILDEAHMIKNFRSQRWNILLMFRSYRRLLLTGTPLQNNLTELWALLQFLMSGSHFANLKEFGDWFSNPLEKAIEMGNILDDETMQRVSKLHTVLRPYLLRRLKRDVEKELPSKFEHLTLCPLSKRQRFLYDEFMSRAQTRDALDSGVYQKIANILMQLRKVCNHPDLFEVRPIVTSFAMPRSAAAEYEIKDLLVRRRFLQDEDERVNFDALGLQFINHQNVSLLASVATRSLDATNVIARSSKNLGDPPPYDTRTKAGWRKYAAYMQRAKTVARWSHVGYLNRLRCSRIPVYSTGLISVAKQLVKPILPYSIVDTRRNYLDNVFNVNKMVKSYADRAHQCSDLIKHFAFVTPPVVATDLPHIALAGYSTTIRSQPLEFDDLLHPINVKLKIAFPDPWLLQYDCGKMQRLATLLREKKTGGHRVLIFTQMTRVLDILEVFLNFHGYLYLRLDGATKIEDRQYITERFNADPRIFCFIASSRSGGVGINLTGADTVIFYDSDFNPQMDRQCEDRAHRIGQIRDVHIYRFVSQHTVEEAMLLKANQKRSLDDIVIQKGEFDWRTLFKDENALTKAMGELEDAEDRYAAAVAAREEFSLVGADEDDFGEVDGQRGASRNNARTATPGDVEGAGAGAGGEEEGGGIVDYLVAFVERDYGYFRDWRL